MHTKNYNRMMQFLRYGVQQMDRWMDGRTEKVTYRKGKKKKKLTEIEPCYKPSTLDHLTTSKSASHLYTFFYLQIFEFIFF